MKFWLLFFLFITQNLWADQIYKNQSGFPVCYQTDKQTYLFNWDDISRTQYKNVFYFKLSDYVQNKKHQISGCEEYKYIRNVPIEILRPIDEIKSELPSEIIIAFEQVQYGARLYRSEMSTTDFINQHPNLFQPDSPSQISLLRDRYGDQFTSNLISTWSQKMIPENTSCDSLIGTCDYYLCAEQKSPCGLDGYNLGFGFKYCSGSKFKLAHDMKTEEGQLWVQNVFQCLQKKSFISHQTGKNNSCESIHKNAFDSHPNCYAQAGFCELNLTDKMKIFKLIKSEILSHATIQQGFALLNLCHISNHDKQKLQQQFQIGGISE